LAESLAYPSGEEGGNFLVQMTFTCLPSRRGRGAGEGVRDPVGSTSVYFYAKSQRFPPNLKFAKKEKKEKNFKFTIFRFSVKIAKLGKCSSPPPPTPKKVALNDPGPARGHLPRLPLGVPPSE
jgi:hypothetical protein